MTNYANPCVAEGDYGSIAPLGYSFSMNGKMDTELHLLTMLR